MAKRNATSGLARQAASTADPAAADPATAAPPGAAARPRPSAASAAPEAPPEGCRTVLALDLGTLTGWALARGGAVLGSGTQAFRLGFYDAHGTPYWRFMRWLTELDEAHDRIDTVVYEAVFAHKGSLAAHKYGAFEGLLLCWCAARDLSVEGIPVGRIKKHATGFGFARKDAVLKAIRARGFTPTDDNEADALALLFYALKDEGPQP